MAKIIFQTILLLSLVIASLSFLHAKDWRGVVPLYSTKADVVKALGKPLDEGETIAVYSLADEEVQVDFSTNYRGCAKELPIQTVLRISVVPKTELKLSTFISGEKGYKRIDPSFARRLPDNGLPTYIIGDDGYINEEAGILVRGYKGNVLAIFYFAAAKDKKLCEDYYKHPEGFGQVIFDFIHTARSLRKSASYGDILVEVTNCLMEIRASPLANCVVVNHGTEKEVSERIRRIIKAIKRSEFDVRRFKFFRGENKSPIATKIFSLPIGVEPPLSRSYY